MTLFVPSFGALQVSCSKPNCDGTFLHRHHKKHEHLWIAVRPKKWNPIVFEAFTSRYFEFHEDDIVLLCARHHAEIHMMYSWEIEKDQRRRRYLALSDYSYQQAQTVMRACERVLAKWLAKETPGIDPHFLGAVRDYPVVKGED